LKADEYLKAKADFERKYGDDMDFDDFLNSQRIARYNMFMSSLQTRDLQ